MVDGVCLSYTMADGVLNTFAQRKQIPTLFPCHAGPEWKLNQTQKQRHSKVHSIEQSAMQTGQSTCFIWNIYIYTHWVCNVCVCVVVEHQHWAGRTIIAKQTVFISCVIWVCGVRLPDSTHYHAHSHHIQTYRPKMHEIHHICISVRIATECIADVRCDTSERSRMKMNVIYYTPIHIIICKCGWLWNPGTTGRGILFFSFFIFFFVHEIRLSSARLQPCTTITRYMRERA